jgi:hypothetical protein
MAVVTGALEQNATTAKADKERRIACSDCVKTFEKQNR